jgi:hypothetical protein
MSHEISWRHTDTGVTLYVTIRSTARTYWNGADLEALTVANWGDYDVALSETPASSYFYVGTFPAGAAVGFYWLDVFVQAGASPAISDTLTGTMAGYWDGATFRPYAPNAVEVSDAVWDEDLTGHTTSDSAGEALGEVTVDPTVAISATQAAAVASGMLAITVYATWTQAITSTMAQDLGGATKLWLAVKASSLDDDDESVFFIEETAGLTVLNGAEYTTTTDGALAVTGSAGDWTVTATLAVDATAALETTGLLLYELKALIGGTVYIVSTGQARVLIGLIKAIE